jgi:CRP-like cAMP-binding protein
MNSTLAERFHSMGSLTQLPKGTFIFGQGDQAKGVFVIDRGHACVSLAGEDGSPIWSRVVGRGAVLGLPSSISGEPYTLTAVAIENVDARFLTRSALCELMTKNGDIANQVVGLISEELADLRRKMSLMKHATDARTPN